MIEILKRISFVFFFISKLIILHAAFPFSFFFSWHFHKRLGKNSLCLNFAMIFSWKMCLKAFRNFMTLHNGNEWSFSWKFLYSFLSLIFYDYINMYTHFIGRKIRLNKSEKLVNNKKGNFLQLSIVQGPLKNCFT